MKFTYRWEWLDGSGLTAKQRKRARETRRLRDECPECGHATTRREYLVRRRATTYTPAEYEAQMKRLGDALASATKARFDSPRRLNAYISGLTVPEFP